MIVIGIDPGTTRCGYGVIKKDGSRLSLLAAGILSSTGPDAPSRLSSLASHLKEIISLYHPERAAIETLYFSRNQKTALSIAEARGAILSVLSAAFLPIQEFSPTEVKSLLTGSGRASKHDIITTVELILKTKIKGVDDICDALAIAILAAGM